MNNAPANEIVPSINLKPESSERIKTERKIIGMSVTAGAVATSMPSFLLCLMVSEITKVKRGPGNNPAARPNSIPEIRNGNASNMKDNIRKKEQMPLLVKSQMPYSLPLEGRGDIG